MNEKSRGRNRINRNCGDVMSDKQREALRQRIREEISGYLSGSDGCYDECADVLTKLFDADTHAIRIERDRYREAFDKLRGAIGWHYVKALQGNYDQLNLESRHTMIEFIDGMPFAIIPLPALPPTPQSTKQEE